MFRKGDRVRFVTTDDLYFKDRVGKLATVMGEEYTKQWGGPYLPVLFDDRQETGGWYPRQFELLFKAGDYVKVVSDDTDFEGSHIGETGQVVLHDGASEGFWPYRVEFADGEDEIYNARDLEASTEEAFAAPAPVEVVTVKAEDEYIEVYMVADEDNEVLTVWDTYEEAYVEAKVASEELNEPLFVYKMVNAFEPGEGKNGRIYNLV